MSEGTDNVSTPTPSPAESPEAPERGRRKVREGLVVSDKMDKTVVVLVEDRVKHALYGKVMRRTSKLKAHDEQNQCGIGDRVQIMETRPLSATKRWRVVEILERAK
jgi:small subunit ribosomal protein S17